MKRQLNENEKKLTEKGIARLKKEMEEVKEAEKIYIARLKYLKIKEEYESIAFPYQMKRENEECEKIIDGIKDQLIQKSNSIKEMEDHILEGVDIKLNKVVDG